MTLQHQRILIVEDEYLVGISLQDSLESEGATVIGPIGSIDDALHILDQCEIDLAVLDINLRGVEVYPVADALEQMKIPFLFASGYDARSLPARFGHRRLVEKPCDIEVLTIIIHSLIQSPVAEVPPGVQDRDSP
jgi:DNA-binding response OmpR family regulator